ncbi:DUF3159 domain-containing protein [Microbacterium sp. KUDC0406]|uniref:DUF3159 domain-containing protein n=1 Tax=Microbacterium sp. KUDC0406 TaxID=2909588 RepID=UPI001F30DF59|nr:DUF3159 domain-containing protein [Microbacterium sp. KUDC0406]UJP11666.1 DUF3159 domain-containing protein [Microbacterium sp. KUDC0406]
MSDAADQDDPQQPAPDALSTAFGDAARRMGLDADQSTSTGHVVWRAMGGWRGIVESVLPGLVFVVVYTLKPEPLWISLVGSVGLAAVFTAVRLIQRSPSGAAFGGLIAAGAAAALALWTGRGEDNFVPGFITNSLYGTAYLISALIGWSLIGLIVGYLMGDGLAWRSDRRRRRTFFWLGIAWAAVFFARLAVQLPLYFAGDVALLGTLKIVMGLPLFAPLVAVTWLVARALYPQGRQVGAADESASE